MDKLRKYGWQLFGKRYFCTKPISAGSRAQE